MAGNDERGSFYDDYEGDCIELWEAIQALQEELREIKAQLRALALMPITK